MAFHVLMWKPGNFYEVLQDNLYDITVGKNFLNKIKICIDSTKYLTILKQRLSVKDMYIPLYISYISLYIYIYREIYIHEKWLLGQGIRLNRTSNFTLSLYPIKNKAKGFREKKRNPWIWEKPDTQQQSFGSWKTDDHKTVEEQVKLVKSSTKLLWNWEWKGEELKKGGWRFWATVSNSLPTKWLTWKQPLPRHDRGGFES